MKNETGSVFQIRDRLSPRPLWFTMLLLLAVTLGSCSSIARDVGLEEGTDLEQRSGVGGTADNPFPLNPFKRYYLVMSGGECRFFTMEVPSAWFWKITLTAANREQDRRGSLRAEIAQSNPPWTPLPASSMSKNFDLAREGVGAVLAVGNTGPTRLALLRLCQDGAPIHVTLQSQIFSTGALLGPMNNQAVTTNNE